MAASASAACPVCRSSYGSSLAAADRARQPQLSGPQPVAVPAPQQMYAAAPPAYPPPGTYLAVPPAAPVFAAYAGFWVRVGAYLLDWLIIAVPLALLSLILLFFAIPGGLIGGWLYFCPHGEL